MKPTEKSFCGGDGRRCVLLWVLFLTLLVPAGKVAAAPHLLGRPEPVLDSIGSFRQEQLARAALSGQSTRFAPGFTRPGPPPATVRIVLLRVDFQPEYDPATTAIDPVPATTGSGLWTDPVYEGDTWVNAIRTRLPAYYAEVSRGQLTLTVEVSPQVYRLRDNAGAERPLSFYGPVTDQSKLEALISDAVRAAQAAVDIPLAKPPGVDAQCIVIVHAGPGQETDTFVNPDNTNGNTPGDLWSLFYRDAAIGTPAVIVDGTLLQEALILPQTGSQDALQIDPLGIYAHEFGHFLGLPDLYPTSGGPGGIGNWDLMDFGAYNNVSGAPIGSSPGWLSAWSRLYLGWETATEPAAPTADPGVTSFVPVEGGVAGGVRLLLLPAAPGVNDRFFLLENRQLLGSDAGLDGHGLLVWKVDEAVLARNFAANTVNNDRTRPGVSLVEADGNGFLLSPGGFAQGSDPFPGTGNNRLLTPYSTPVSSMTAFGSGWVNLDAISEEPATGMVSADVGLGPLDVQGVSASYASGIVDLDWLANPDAVAYTVYRSGGAIGTTTETTFADPAGSTTALYGVGSVDAAGNATIPLPAAGVRPTVAAANGGQGRCFIATAAYGSYEAPAVQLLRTFRDRVLLANAPGRALVRLYYRVSPPLAQTIAPSPVLRAVVRLLLWPLIVLAAFCVLLSPLQQLGCAVLTAAACFVLLRGHRRQGTAADPQIRVVAVERRFHLIRKWIEDFRSTDRFPL